MGKFKICIDAGHYKNYNKGIVSGYYEGNQMFKLSQYEQEAFEEYEDVEVVLTKAKEGSNPSLATRGKTAKGFDLFISNHSNAPASSAYSEIRGVSVLDSVTRSNKSIAETIGKAVAKTMGNNFRGVVYRKGSNGDYYGVLRNSIAVGCKCCILIEHGFHTNKEDCGFLMNDNNLKELAKVKASTIAQIFGLKKITKEKKYYRIRKTWKDAKSQIGAYVSLDGSKSIADKNKGYSVFDWDGKLVYSGVIKEEIPESDYHVVEADDTLWGIAHEYSMAIKDLKKLNSLKSDSIYVGDKLKLNKKAKVSAKVSVSKSVSKTPKKRSKIEIIKDLQTSLNSCGLKDNNGRKLSVDGILGASSEYVIKTNIIKNGSRNEFVKFIQKRLNELGDNLVADGIFGGSTEKAIKSFQGKNRLTKDGIVGIGTITKLVK